MVNVTRFNPTANGDLHLGHVYVMLFNQHLAHSTGGRFIVRFEDNQPDSLLDLGAAAMQRFVRRQREAIEWLEIEVDDYLYQSDMDLALKEFAARNGCFIPAYRFPYSIPLNPALGDYNPEQGEWFPYAPYVTFSKVIYDEVCGVNVLVRGDDLRSEFSLYQHYRAEFGLPEIPHYYLPRLYQTNGGILSKFHGARPVLAYREGGWSPDAVKGLLAQCALKDKSRGWRLDNVQRSPRLVQEFNLSV